MMLERENNMIAFGPVPSRRTGRSIGINNIPSIVVQISVYTAKLEKQTICRLNGGASHEGERFKRFAI